MLPIGKISDRMRCERGESKKKRAETFLKFLVYFCENFAEKGCISEFLSEKHPI
jgi:hypothetical protein